MTENSKSKPWQKLAYGLLCTAMLLSVSQTAIAQPDADAKPAGDTEAEANAAAENPFPGRFPAPSLDGGTEWLNCSGEISIQDLRGKVVVLDFWTYCCINCIHVLPDLKYLEEKYKDQLVVIGVHSAKFDNEKESENIREAIMRYEIAHPVVNDSDMIIARKYFFSSWPTFVLIDPEGKFVGRQPGEGNRELFDTVIGQMVTYHRKKGTLDETPIRFNLEKQKAKPTPLRYPGKVTVDNENNRLFISDSNHNRIVVSSLDGELIDIIGNGAIGATDGDFATATFDHPQGTTLVGDNLYVADTENHLLRVVNLATKQVTTLAGTGQQARFRNGGGPIKTTALNSPWDVLHLKGNLYIAMAGPHQLWKHKLGSDKVELYAGTGREDIIDGTREDCALAQPSAITTDGTDLYIVDSEGSAIRKIETGSSAAVTTVVGPHDIPRGQSLFEFGDIDGKGDEVRMQHPIGAVWDNGKLYVADTYNDKIKLVDVKSREASSWLGTGERGTGLKPAELFEPAGLAVAGENLIIADTNNHRLLKVNLKTKATTELVISGLTPPSPQQKVEEKTTGPSETLKPVRVKSGAVQVKVNFEFKDGYKLNKLAPVVYKLTTGAGASALPAEALNKRRRAMSDGTSAGFEIPVTAKTGSSTVTIDLSYQYCRDGVGGLCKFGTQQWVVPIEITDDGTSEVTVTVRPKEAKK